MARMHKIGVIKIMNTGSEDRKTYVITGATSGVGYALTKVLLEENVKLILIVRSKEKADKLIKEFNNTDKIDFVYADLVDIEKISEALAPFKEVAIDGFVHCAGIVDLQTLRKTTVAKFERLMRVNFLSFVEILRLLTISKKTDRRFRVVAISSVSSFRPDRTNHMYSASKAAQTNMMQSLSLQLAKDGITVNNVAPGVIYTDRNVEALSDPEYAKKVTDSIPVGFYGEPEDCAGIVSLLCSDEGRYITGQNIFVDGGKSVQ